MYFDLSDEQKSIFDSVTSVLRDALPDDRLVAKFDSGALDQPLWKDLSGLGLGGILVPEEYGGLDMGLLTLAVVSEALGHAGAAAPVVQNCLAAWLIAQSGDAAQRTRWLEALIAGEAVAALALPVPGRALDAPAFSDGSTLDGVFRCVEWGVDADLIIVGTADGALALVEANATGVLRTAVETVDRSRPLADIRFERAAAEPLRVPADATGRLRDALLVLLAADAYGAARRALSLALDYAKVRVQFDRVIGSFQGMKHQFANATAELEPCRQLYWYAAYAWDAIPDKRAHAAAMTKAHVTDTAVRVARLSIELHGGIGYTWEYPAHLFLKRSMHDRASAGLPSLHRLRAADLADW